MSEKLCEQRMYRILKDLVWVSIEKDNMEFKCITTCYVIDDIQEVLKDYEEYNK